MFNFDINPDEMSSLNLAYIGDAIYELYVRTMLLQRGNIPVSKLHRAATEHVKASAQSIAAGVIEPLLNDEELGVFKRGRNANSKTTAKNANILDYRRATGLEALFGYLYLEKKFDRLYELMRISFDGGENRR